MSTATNVADRCEVSSWAEICETYPCEWVCLTDVENQTNGSFRARLLCHSPRPSDILDEVRHLLDLCTNEPISILNTALFVFGGPRIVETVDEGHKLHAEERVDIRWCDGSWPGRAH
jgi:hypothetical protein